MILLGIVLSFLPACAPTHRPAPSPLEEAPEELAAELRAAESGTESDRTLHRLEGASLALWYGDAALAGRLLDRVIADIETIYGDDEAPAVEARRLYHAEREKPFKGEPYERMMAYVYRGLLDYGAHDFQNAAAAFRSAILQDAFADEQQDRCDFELAEYLLARARLRSGADRRSVDEAYAAAREISERHGTALPSLDADEDVLLVLELGAAPFKVAQGEERELLVAGRRAPEGLHARVRVDNGGAVVTSETASLSFQALTRGGRAFDFLLAGQAFVKRTTEEGTISVNAIGTALNFVLPPVGFSLQVASLVAKAAGMGIRPEADTRHWRRLPDAFHVVPLKIGKGGSELRVTFHDAKGRRRPDREIVVRIESGRSVERLVWISAQDPWPDRSLVFGGDA